MQAAKVLTRLRICAVSSEASQLADAILPKSYIDSQQNRLDETCLTYMRSFRCMLFGLNLYILNKCANSNDTCAEARLGQCCSPI